MVRLLHNNRQECFDDALAHRARNKHMRNPSGVSHSDNRREVCGCCCCYAIASRGLDDWTADDSLPLVRTSPLWPQCFFGST